MKKDSQTGSNDENGKLRHAKLFWSRPTIRSFPLSTINTFPTLILLNPLHYLLVRCSYTIPHTFTPYLIMPSIDSAASLAGRLWSALTPLNELFDRLHCDEPTARAEVPQKGSVCQKGPDLKGFKRKISILYATKPCKRNAVPDFQWEKPYLSSFNLVSEHMEVFLASLQVSFILQGGISTGEPCFLHL